MISSGGERLPGLRPITGMTTAEAVTGPPVRGEPLTAPRFEELYDEHAGGLHRYLAAQAGGCAAEDLVAETFLAAWAHRVDDDPDRAPARAWLYGIAVNLLRRHRRHQVRTLRAVGRVAGRSRTEAAGEGHEERVAERLDAAGRAALLAKAIEQLHPGDREVLLLTSWAGLDAAEVAAALGIPVGTRQVPGAPGAQRAAAVPVHPHPRLVGQPDRGPPVPLSRGEPDRGLGAPRPAGRVAPARADHRQAEVARGQRGGVPGGRPHLRRTEVANVRARCGAFYGEASDGDAAPIPTPRPAKGNSTKACTREGTWGDPTERFLAGLPRDPDALFDRLREDTRGRGQHPDGEVLVYVADVLRSGAGARRPPCGPLPGADPAAGPPGDQ